MLILFKYICGGSDYEKEKEVEQETITVSKNEGDLLNMKRKKYDPLKGVNMQTRMLATETIGVGLAFKVAGTDANALKVASMGTSLAGMPSLAYGAGNVLNSLSMLTPSKKKKKY